MFTFQNEAEAKNLHSNGITYKFMNTCAVVHMDVMTSVALYAKDLLRDNDNTQETTSGKLLLETTKLEIALGIRSKISSAPLNITIKISGSLGIRKSCKKKHVSYNQLKSLLSCGNFKGIAYTNMRELKLRRMLTLIIKLINLLINLLDLKYVNVGA